MHNWRMFRRLISRAVWFRKLPSIVAVLAIMLGTGVIGGLVNIYFDMNQKMGKEFRTYGANLIIYPANSNEKIEPKLLNQLNTSLSGGKLMGLAPMQYSIAQLEKSPVVLVGTWFDQIKQVSPYWNVEGNWIGQRDQMGETMVGTAVAKKYDLKPGAEVELNPGAGQRPVKLKVAGIITTGGKEDNQVFVSTKLASQLSKNDQVDIVMVSLLANGTELEQKAEQIQADVPTLSVKPIKQMAESEVKMVGKIEKLVYLVSVVIFITTILTIMTTMVSMVMERRKEVGLKKALGASESKLISEFLMEGLLLAIVGSTLGLGLSYGVAQLIGQSVFHSEITFRFLIIPWAYLAALIVIALAFVIPVRRIMEVEPAIVLKGE